MQRPPEGLNDDELQAWEDWLLLQAEALDQEDAEPAFEITGPAIRELLATLVASRLVEGDAAQAASAAPQALELPPDLPASLAEALSGALLAEAELEPWELEALLQAELDAEGADT